VRLGGSHLTYCTNIHPGESWNEVSANLERYLPRVKRRVCPDRPFGVGLRLSAVAARSLNAPDALARFAEFLRANDLYVFTINGFPYGPFHGAPVKENVYLPDWRDDARLEYTNGLADILAAMLPAHGDVGSVSTVPGAFKPNAVADEAVARIAHQLIRHVAHLVRLERDSGRVIVLALEPEPCCLLETIAETVAFFAAHLYSKPAATALASLAGCELHEAEHALRRHLGVCLDTCHAAVEFEDPAGCLDALAGAGIPIAKMQVTAGLRIPRVTSETVAALQSLAEPVYLHQLVERNRATLRRYVDIGDGCRAASWRGGDCEWRVHFHVPVFLEQLEAFSSTQPFVREMLALHRQQPRTPHLEVETYTWSVLPARVRDIPIEDAIARELLWVQGELS
jgi:sugar phosphate isomerase/epimerase